MAVIKITNKHAIDEMQAKLILRLGRKITQQETLDLCIQYAQENFDNILQLASATPMLSPKKAEEIIMRFKKYADTPYMEHAEFESDIDQDIYNFSTGD